MGSTNNGRRASEQQGAGEHRGRRLLSCIERGDVATIRDEGLLEELCSTVDDRPASSGWTPVMLAAAKGDDEITRLLLEAGGGAGHALPIACALGHRDVARSLIAGGADITLEGPGGMNALSFAAQAGNDDLVQDLIRAGLSVDARESSTGMTALGRAASPGTPTPPPHSGERAPPWTTGTGGVSRRFSTPRARPTVSPAERCWREGRSQPTLRRGSGALWARRSPRGPTSNSRMAASRSGPTTRRICCRWGPPPPLGSGGRPAGSELGRARGLGYATIVKTLSEFSGEADRERSPELPRSTWPSPLGDNGVMRAILRILPAALLLAALALLGWTAFGTSSPKETPAEGAGDRSPRGRA